MNEDVNILPDQTPEQAVSILNESNNTGLNPSEVQANTPVDNIKAVMPTKVDRSVAQSMDESTVKASAIAPDAQKISDVAKGVDSAVELDFISHVGKSMDVSNLSRQRSDKALEIRDLRAKGLKPTEDQMFELDALTYQKEEIGTELSNSKAGYIQQGASAIVTSLTDMVKDVYNRPEGAAIGAAVGAASGYVASKWLKKIPRIGTLLEGATIGAGAVKGALTAPSFIANKDRFTGEMYADLDKITDDNGRPLNLPESEKNQISNAVGIFGAGLETVADVLFFDSVPALKKLFSGKEAAKVIIKNKALKQSIINFGKAFAKQGTAEAITENLQNFGDMLGKAKGEQWDGNPATLSKALDRVTYQMNSNDVIMRVNDEGKKVPVIDKDGRPVTYRQKFIGEFKDTTVVSFLAGAGTAGGASVIGDVYTNATTKKAAKKLGKSPEAVVTGTQTKAPVTPVVEAPVEVDTDTISDADGTPTDLNPQQSIIFAATLDGVNKELQDTKLAGSEADVGEMNAKILRDRGLDKFWVTEKTLKARMKTEAGVEKITQILFGKEATQYIGGKILLNADEFVALQQLEPGISNDVSYEPTALTVNELKAGIKHGEQTGQDFLAQQGLKQAIDAPTVESTVPAVDTTQLGTGSTDQEITSTLNTRQEADAYLSRLADEETKTINDAQQINFDGTVEPIQQETVTQPNNERLTQIQQMRERVSAIRETLQEAPQGIEEQLTDVEEVNAVLDAYVTAPVVSDLIKSGMTPEQVTMIESKTLEIRQQIADASKSAVMAEANQVMNVVDEIDKVEDSIQVANDIVNDPMIQKVDLFLSRVKDLQVDPASLTQEQRSAFSEHVVLQKRKFFKKGGMHIGDLAYELGFKDANEALEVISSTPDSKQAQLNAEEIRQKNVDEDIKSNTPLLVQGLVNAIENKQKLNLEMIKMMMENASNNVRGIIESVVFAKIDLENIKAEVKDIIGTSKYSTININNYLRASKIAGVKAVKAALRGDFLEASRQREIQIRADEFYKQAKVAKVKSNNIIKTLAKRARSETTRTTLKEGGGLKAFEAINQIFKIEPIKSESKVKDLEAYMNKQENDQIETPIVTPELMAGYDPRARLEDLSVDQLATVYDLTTKIIEQAKLKQEVKLNGQINYMNAVEQKVSSETLSNPAYNDKTKIEAENSQGLLSKSVDMILGTHASLKNFQNIMLTLAQGNPDSIFMTLYTSLKNAEANKDQMFIQIRNRLTDKLKEHGEKRINGLDTEWVVVPEFEGSTGLLDGNGRIRKSDLLTMVAYYGSRIGRERLRNFNIDPDTVLTVAERELTQADVDFVQEGVHDTYELLKEPIANNQRDLGQDDVEFTQGYGYTLFGKQYRGGHIPIVYRKKLTPGERAAAFKAKLAQALGTEKSPPLDASTLSSFTREGFKIARVENFDGLLSLNFGSIVAKGFDDAVVDINMHSPIKEVVTVLVNKNNAENIQNVVGSEQYIAMVNNVIGLATGTVSDRIEMAQDLEQGLLKLGTYITAKNVKNLIILSPSAMFSQFASVAYLFGNTSMTSKYYAMSGIAKLIMNPHMLPAAFEAARRIDNSIGQYLYNVDESNKGAVADLLPGDASVNPAMRLMESADDAISVLGFKYMLGTIDNTFKLGAVLGLFNYYYNSKELASLTEIDRVQRATELTRAKSQNILTASSKLEQSMFQKTATYKGWVNFFNDARNIYNITTFNINQIWQDAKKSKQALGRGDVKNAIKYGLGVGGNALMLQLTATIAGTVLMAASGRDEEGEDLPAMFTGEWDKKMLESSIYRFVNPFTNVKTIVNSVPLVRDFVFNLEVADNTGGGFVTIIQSMTGNALNKLAGGFRALQAAGFEREYTKKEKNQLIDAASTLIPLPSKFTKSLLSDEETPSWFEEYSADPGISFLPVTIPALAYLAYQKLADTKAEASDGGETQSLLEQSVNLLDPQKAELIARIKSGEIEIMSEEEEMFIQYAESTGRSNAVNDSGATGLFQFMPDTWSSLIGKYPALGLTANGRYNVEQQWRAFRMLAIEHAEDLIQDGLPVNIDTLYAMHHFGSGLTRRILKKDDTETLPMMTAQRADNPWLNGDVDWVNNGQRVRTVGDFKRGLRDILNRGEQLYIETLDLN